MHGGDGEEGGVLAMRCFAPTALSRDLRAAGFTEITSGPSRALSSGSPKPRRSERSMPGFPIVARRAIRAR